MAKKETRYRLVHDNYGYHYLILAEKLNAWWKWLDKDKEGSPDWAQRIGFAEYMVTFTSPEVD